MTDQNEAQTLPQLVKSRVLGLDGIRFWLALVVLIGHGRLGTSLDIEGHPIGKVIKGILSNSLCGPAAVTVFFVVSGFCIHFPYRSGTRDLPDYASFLARRWVRTLVPLGFAYLLAIWLAGDSAVLNMVVWSLVCEEIYYLLYPGIRWLGSRFGWAQFATASFLCAALLILMHPGLRTIWAFGYELTWIVGLPWWLLGCLLAEQSDGIRSVLPRSRFSIGWWRFAAWVLATGASILRFHGGIGYPWTLSLFSIFAFFWMKREIVHYMNHTPNRVFEWLGGVSYSLYLVHIPFLIYLKETLPDGNLMLWGFQVILIAIGLCILFGIVIERPFHHAARKIGAWIASRANGGPPKVRSGGALP